MLSLSVGIEEFAISTLEKTQAYWEEFVSYLAVRVTFSLVQKFFEL